MSMERPFFSSFLLFLYNILPLHQYFDVTTTTANTYVEKEVSHFFNEFHISERKILQIVYSI